MYTLVCWKENRTKKWDMVKDKDRDALLMNLLMNNKVDKHTIFIIPTSSILGGIWLWAQTHKSDRVDFYNFYEDFGTKYVKPKVKDELKDTLTEIEEKKSNNFKTKYGWISPTGKYFHCGYQGHINLASEICFGMIDTDNPERYLEEHGWCKIYKSLFDNEYSVYVGGNYTITDAQMKTLIELGLDKAKHLSSMLVKE